MAKSYFVSDFHLGVPSYEASLEREKQIVAWLESIASDCETLFLLGDIFDFWFEYKTVVPRNYTRLLGQLAKMTDNGCHLFFFKGNHDMWTFDYLKQEIGAKIVDNEWIGEINGKRFYLHHGDALWNGEKGYKLIKFVFRSKLGIWLFHRLHPNFGIGLANLLSRKSRAANAESDQLEIPLEKDYQYQFAKAYSENNSIDYFVFGHRHKPLVLDLPNGSKMINLGDWINHFTYGVFDGNAFELKHID